MTFYYRGEDDLLIGHRSGPEYSEIYFVPDFITVISIWNGYDDGMWNQLYAKLPEMYLKNVTFYDVAHNNALEHMMNILTRAKSVHTLVLEYCLSTRRVPVEIISKIKGLSQFEIEPHGILSPSTAIWIGNMLRTLNGLRIENAIMTAGQIHDMIKDSSTNLRYLNISNCTMKLESMIHLIKAFHHFYNLECLILSSNNVIGHGEWLPELAEALPFMSTLKKLDLSGNTFRTIGHFDLNLFTTNIETLDLSGCEMHRESLDLIKKRLPDSLKHFFIFSDD